jgi:hypothetical protein
MSRLDNAGEPVVVIRRANASEATPSLAENCTASLGPAASLA